MGQADMINQTGREAEEAKKKARTERSHLGVLCREMASGTSTFARPDYGRDDGRKRKGDATTRRRREEEEKKNLAKTAKEEKSEDRAGFLFAGRQREEA